MKVLQVINSLGTGGAEKLLLDTIPRFIEANIDVELLLLDGTNYPFLDALKKTGKVKIHSLGKKSVYNLFHIFKIIPFFRKFDLIHVHLFPSLYWVAAAKRISFSKTPILFTEHNTTNKRRNHFVLKRIDKFVYNTYSTIITISEEVDRLLKEYLPFNDPKFILIPNGIDLQKMENALPANKLEFTTLETEKIIIQVSSFTNQKDQKTLIKSIPLLSNQVKLLLVGVGESMESCKKLVHDLALQDRVLFLETRMDVPELLKMADIVVLSTNFEGLSLSSIEALASGNPFLASNAPGLAPIVKGAGILFPIGDPIFLAGEIDKLLNDTGYYNETAGKCKARAQMFGIQKMVDKHINLYTQVCSNKN